MQLKLIEASHGGGGNWGKFALGRFTAREWSERSALPEAPGHRLLAGRGWSREHVLFLDLETGEGAILAPRPGASPSADLRKHSVWVCPLAESFLAWLYRQDLTDLDALPAYVELPDAPFALAGYRRTGPAPGASTPAESFMTVSEVAACLRVTAATVRGWIARGTLPAVRLGRPVRVRRADFDALVKASRVPARGEYTDAGSQSADATAPQTTRQ